MMKWVYLFVAGFLLASCSSTNKSLYSWGKYSVSSYNYLLKNDEKSAQYLLEKYEALIATQQGTRKVVPPGIYGDYGFMLLQRGNTAQGTAMLEKEMALYPESRVFIERIIKMGKW